MMADFVGCMPVFPEFEYLDYNYFNPGGLSQTKIGITLGLKGHFLKLTSPTKGLDLSLVCPTIGHIFSLKYTSWVKFFMAVPYHRSVFSTTSALEFRKIRLILIPCNQIK